MTHVVMTKHYSLWDPCGALVVHQGAALIGLLGVNDLI